MESPIATTSDPAAAPPDIELTESEEATQPSTTASPAQEMQARGPAQWVQRIGSFLDERTGLSALRYAVPAHANSFWYTLGGITFVGLLILVATGMWLAQFYNPDPSAARESVIYIQTKAPLGDVIRGIHVWTAYMVSLTALLHLIRVFVTAAYKRPREFNWFIGLAMFALLLFGAVFTGSVLRWDQEAFEALEHNTATAQLMGAIGNFFSGGFTASTSILPRLYIAHISIVPLMLAVLLVAHIFLIKRHGISPLPQQADAGLAPHGQLPKALQLARYTTHLRVMVGYGLALLATAGLLSLLFPLPIGPAPDPTMEVTKPAFLFYWAYAFEDWFGIKGILYSATGLFGLLALVPLIDFSRFRRIRGWRIVVVALGAALLIAVVALSIMVALQAPAKHLGM
jgi:quinol-cytochrome oxidoreductase complex cytochrome b subunit